MYLALNTLNISLPLIEPLCISLWIIKLPNIKLDLFPIFQKQYKYLQLFREIQQKHYQHISIYTNGFKKHNKARKAAIIKQQQKYANKYIHNFSEKQTNI